MTATAFHPLAMPTLMMLSVVSFAGCDTPECSNQGACGEDAWCSPEGVCLPFDDVVAGGFDDPDAPAPRMGDPDRGISEGGGGGNLTVDNQLGPDVVSVDLEGTIGWFEVAPVNEQSVWVNGLLPDGNWRVEVWLRGQTHYLAGLFIDVDEAVRLDEGPQTVNALVTACSTPNAFGEFAYDRFIETEVTVTPTDSGGYIVELGDTGLVDAKGPIAATVRMEAAEALVEDAP
jgi:hypothetical protein